MQRKAVLLFSGGPDSTSAAYLLKDSRNLVLFTVHEPERTRNHSEVASALKIAKGIELPHKVIDMAFSNQLFDDVERIAVGLGGGNAPGKGNILPLSLSKAKCVAPGKSEAPFSLAFLHLSAAIYAAAHDVEEIIWAVHRDDDVPAGWIAQYTEQFNMLIRCFVARVHMSTPVLGYSKRELLDLGGRAGAPLADTFSCLVNSDGTHCGSCHGCIERAAALNSFDANNPTMAAANAA